MAGETLVHIRYEDGLKRLGFRPTSLGVLPKTWGHRIDDPDLPYVVEMDCLVTEEGRPECREMTIRAREGGPAVTNTGARRLPVAGLMLRGAWEVARGPKLEPKVFAPTVIPGDDPYIDLYPEVERRGWQKRDYERLQRVAEIYRRAYERGDPPTETVARIEGVGRSAAAKLVHAARNAEPPLLGRAMRGRAGV